MGSKTEVTMAARSSSSAVALLMMVYMAEVWGSPVISVLIIGDAVFAAEVSHIVDYLHHF